MTGEQTRIRRWTQATWLGLLYTIGVVLFGAVVRITGSGAGCGQHWPTCHGEVAHLPQTLETVIELTHRVTSGLSTVVVIALWLTARRVFPVAHAARRFIGASVIFNLIEGAIGAGLVLFELVAHDKSAARAVAMPAHLVNTFLLLGAIALAAWSAAGSRIELRPLRGTGAAVVGALFTVLVVSMTGAVTALGDTLYPVAFGKAAAARALATDAHFLEQLRAVHPLIAVLGSGYVLMLVPYLAERSSRAAAQTWARRTKFLMIGQLLLGALNIWLSAPGYMQVLHLALANLVWIALLLFSAELRAAPVTASLGPAVRPQTAAPA